MALILVKELFERTSIDCPLDPAFYEAFIPSVFYRTIHGHIAIQDAAFDALVILEEL